MRFVQNRNEVLRKNGSNYYNLVDSGTEVINKCMYYDNKNNNKTADTYKFKL